MQSRCWGTSRKASPAGALAVGGRVWFWLLGPPAPSATRGTRWPFPIQIFHDPVGWHWDRGLSPAVEAAAGGTRAGEIRDCSSRRVMSQ